MKKYFVFAMSLLACMLTIAGCGESNVMNDSGDSNSVVTEINPDDMHQIIENGKRGYIDKDGNIIIEPKYDMIEIFKDGLARVSVGADTTMGYYYRRGGKYGYIDATGKIVIDTIFDEIEYFEDGLARFKINGKRGIIDKAGNYVVKPLYEDLGFFSEDLARVKSDGKWGYIDRSGKYVIEPQYEFAYGFSDGVASVRVDGKFGYIDKTGKFVITPQFADAGSFLGGLACVSMGGDKWWYINKNGDKVYHEMDGANELFDFLRVWVQDIDAQKADTIK
ncbi:MAG: WG repeat-containing protein [Bacteroidales bacterium]|nr:WG repeat-containing protein [Bacteroidales bacterium]